MKKGIQLSFVTAIISGFSVWTNSIFVSKADPLVFALARNALVALLLTVVLVLINQHKNLKRLSTRQWLQLIGIGAIGGGLPFALFFTGLKEIGAVHGNLIHKTLFLWVALLAVPILKEKLTKLQIIGYGIVLVGTIGIGGVSAHVLAAKGSLLVLAATLLWAAENVLAKVTLKDVSSPVVAWGRMIFGLPWLLVAVIVLGKAGVLFQSTTYAVAPMAVSSLFLVGYVTTWYAALSKAPATLVSSVLVIAPAITVMLGSAVFARGMTQEQIVRYGITAVGILFIIRKSVPRGAVVAR